MNISSRVLINATTLVQGGALQVALNLVVAALNDQEAADWQYAISKQLALQLAEAGVDISAPQFHVFEKTPARSSKAARQLELLEQHVNPRLIFTVFGPAYVRFRAPHVCGVGDGWVTHSSWLAIKTLRTPSAITLMAMNCLRKALWFKRADYWITEAEVARQGLIRRLGCPSSRIFVVPNTAGKGFCDHTFTPRFQTEGTKQILTLCSYYPHKGLDSIPRVARCIRDRRPDLDFTFSLTLQPHAPETLRIVRKATELDVAEQVRNLGPIPVARLPALYDQTQISFLPTLLETFTAVYPESMIAGVPIVTTNLQFARDICGDAARYFTALNVDEAATQLITLLDSQDQWEAQSLRGLDCFHALPSADAKWAQQKETLLLISRRLAEEKRDFSKP